MGGTKILCAVVQDGKILERHEVPTPATGYPDVLSAISKSVAPLLHKHRDVHAVGLGCPGPLEQSEGKILFTPNIPGMEQMPIVADLMAQLDKHVVLENDATAAGYAEHRFGAARGLKSSIFITISTGVGGGIFLNDRVVRGKHGNAGEIGHLTVLPGGPLCGCGQHGCWESVAGGRALAREATYSYGQAVTTAELFARAKSGEAKALSIVDNAARFSGQAIGSLVKIFDIHGFVLGGGMMRAGDFYLEKLKNEAERFSRGFATPKLLRAELGTDAGVIGAASLALPDSL